jgi:NAD(P)-dependent dehydrogenase (short-subunit alcohol dehydrogenase family)
MIDQPATVVITGANRGLGLELARVFAGRGHTVIGGCRNPATATELAAVTSHVHAVDTGDEASIAAFADAIGDGVVDVLINNAGLSAEGLGAGPDARDVLQLEPEHFIGQMRVNALGPMLLARALLPALRRSPRPRIVNVSSQVGSMVVGARVGRDVGYSASKAALNMITVKLASRLRDDGVIAVALHPGYLRTAMGGPHADLDPAVAASQIADLVDGLTLEDSGSFLRWDGSEHPW